MPEEHVHNDWYKNMGKEQIVSLAVEIQGRFRTDTTHYGVTRTGSIDGIRFTVDIDEMNKNADRIDLIHYRIGYAQAENLRMILYRHITGEVSDQPIRFITRGLFDNETLEFSPGDEGYVLRDLKKNIEYIHGGIYPPKPVGKWVCSSCPFHIVCPS
jgi:CRISPR/Cas system-associated exonuclease Cas4 (RecB family)